MFYQAKYSQHGDQIKVESGVDFSFPAHLHSSFELITVTEGEMVVTVDKKQYHLTPGKAVLVFPNQLHMLHTPEHSAHILCIFSTQLVKAFSGVYLQSLPDCPVFTPDSFYIRQLQTLAEGSSLLKVKGLLYALCATFDEGAQYHRRKGGEEDLLGKIFRFVEDNYTNDCSLQTLADSTSYHKVYLSRYFKQCTGLTFTEHVNRYRINEASYMLKNSKQKMLEIAYSCGFDSLRSFNRSFKAVMGMSPSAYREK